MSFSVGSTYMHAVTRGRFLTHRLFIALYSWTLSFLLFGR